MDAAWADSVLKGHRRARRRDSGRMPSFSLFLKQPVLIQIHTEIFTHKITRGAWGLLLDTDGAKWE